ncbi:MAG: DUF2586 family protein [Rikenellaceae bacterium]
MSMPNVSITLGNGNLGTVTLSDDGIAGLILTGAAVTGKLELNKVYILSSATDLDDLGVTESNNPLVYKDVVAFYTAAGDGAELHLLVVSDATTLAAMCATTSGSPLQVLIDSAAGNIRLVGINRNPPSTYEAAESQCMDKDVITAAEAAQSVAASYMGKIAPFAIFIPALGWDGEVDGIFKPRECSYNYVSIVLASDGEIGDYYSASIGQIVGRAATCAVNISLARVKDGSIASYGYLTNGNTPEDDYSLWETLHDAGYIFYRTYIGKSGYYFNDDPTASPTTDDYCRLCRLRVIQKAVVICYKTYIDEIMDSIAVDSDGKISQPICKYYEQLLSRAINTNMSDEISDLVIYVDPDQNIITTGALGVSCKIVPTGLITEINVDLSFTSSTSD